MKSDHIASESVNLHYCENLSNPDTNGAEGSVIVSEVSSFQRLKCMQELASFPGLPR